MSSPADYYNGLPPITRAFATACFATTVGVQFGLVNPRSIFLNWLLVGKHFQIWRLFTNFIFLGGFSFAFVMRMLYILRYGVQLERSAYEGRPADFAWMMIFTMLVLLGIQLLLPFTNTPFGSVPLVFALVYLWSREFPTASVSIFGLFQVKAFYLPWTLMAIDMLMGQPIIEDAMGIVAAHLYYFLAVLYPRTNGGVNYMQTPELVRSLVASAFGGVAGPGGRVQQAAPRAFQGRARRLAD